MLNHLVRVLALLFALLLILTFCIYCVYVQEAIRRATIAQKFVPVFMGSAFKNKVIAFFGYKDDICASLDGIFTYAP